MKPKYDKKILLLFTFLLILLGDFFGNTILKVLSIIYNVLNQTMSNITYLFVIIFWILCLYKLKLSENKSLLISILFFIASISFQLLGNDKLVEKLFSYSIIFLTIFLGQRLKNNDKI